MKKTILKIFATATLIIALFFIVFLILATFNQIKPEEFDNTIVRTICIVLGSIFVLLSVSSHVILYINEDAVKEIILRSGKDGTARTSLAVIKKITKETSKGIEGVKCRKCAVVSNDYGIRLKVWIIAKDRDMKETEELIRACLEDAFLGALDFRFFAIDIHLKKLEAKHKVDKAAIQEKLKEEAEKKEETKIEQEQPILSEQPEEVMDAVSEEKTDVSSEVADKTEEAAEAPVESAETERE